jgi:hypothetical protein
VVRQTILVYGKVQRVWAELSVLPCVVAGTDGVGYALWDGSGFFIFEMFLPKFTNGEKFTVEVIKVGRYGELEELDRVRPSCSRPPPPISPGSLCR